MELTMWAVTDDYMALSEFDLSVCSIYHCMWECEFECIEDSINEECNCMWEAVL